VTTHRTPHFTPVGSSWINQIETWFGIITRQSIRRGTFTSVKVLIKQIRDYIAAWNTDPRPFAWTATADEILLLPWAKHVCGMVGGCRCSLVAPAAQDRQIRLGGSLAAR
jgi:hypothetical protein